MNEPGAMLLTEIPLTSIVGLNAGEVLFDETGVLLTTDRGKWAYSAEVEFEIPGIARETRIISVTLAVESGAIGLGWSTPDGADWVCRGSAVATSDGEVQLALPAGTFGGKLIFDNWNTAGALSRVRITSIKILQPKVAPVSSEAAFRAGLAEEQAGQIEAAIELYKRALSIDPSHIESIAALGRLRFVAPAQPLIEEIRRRAPVHVCEVIIAVRNPCNFRCFFCVAAGSNNEPTKPFNFAEIEKAYTQLDAQLIVTSLECGGGEPTVHPQFRELLKLCGRFGPVSMPTNNSQNPGRWLPREIAPKLEVRAALHPESEAQLDKFLSYAMFLMDSGAEFRCSFIAHPTRLDQIPKYQKIFEEHGIPFIAVPFIGSFEGKMYPHSYSEHQFDMVRYWGTGSAPRMRPDQAVTISPHVNRIRNFRGIPCIAGYRYIYIAPDGRMQRCLYDNQPLDAPMAEPKPCQVKSCGCGLFLEKLNFSQMADFYDYFSERADLPRIQLDWMDAFAQTIGFKNAEAAIAAEHMAMYDALMAAYGKDEFRE